MGNSNKKRTLKSKGLVLVASTLMVIGGVYAMIRGVSEDDVEGGIQTLGIDTRIESLNQKEEDLVEGDKVTYVLKTEVKDFEEKGVDAKVRHRVILSEKDRKLVRDGKIKLMIEGKELGNKEELITEVSKIKVGEVKDSVIEIEVGGSRTNNLESRFEVGVITEAIQDAYSTGEDFEDYSVVVGEDVIMGGSEVKSVESRK